MLRAALLVVHIAWGLILATLLAFGAARRSRERLAQRWHNRLLGIFGVRLRVEGAPLHEPHITVANHVSWLDIPILGALEPTRFVGKSEIRLWPIAGWLATAAGTFFLRRGKGGAALLVDRLVPHLLAKGSLVIFPEGTTTDGTEVRPFHARLLGAAIGAQRPIQPVTIQYGLSEDGDNIAPFIGDDSLGAHVLRLLQNPRLHARVVYGPPIRPTVGRDQLASEAESFVRAALQPPARPRASEPVAIPHWLRA